MTIRGRRLIPRPLRRGLRRLQEIGDPVSIALYRRRSGDRRPVPPPLLRERVGATTIDSWFFVGRRWADAIRASLGAVGTEIESHPRVLDFGCGAGKVLQYLVENPALELSGCEIHARSARWGASAYPSATIVHNDFDPPLPFDQEAFDLIYAWSVFTHLDEDRQFAWLDELGRVLTPGGILLASTKEPDVGNAPGGFSFAAYDTAGASNAEEWSGTSEPYGVARHSHAYIRERWARGFEVAAILPQGLDRMDVVVLRKGES